MRKLGWIVGLALVLAACTGGGSDRADPTVLTSATTSATTGPPGTAAPVPPTVEQPPSSSPEPGPGGPADFDDRRLRLGAGAGFVVLDDPVLVRAEEATWLDPTEIVLGLVGPDGEAQAYPISQMAYHHVANTNVAGRAYLVTY